MHSLMGAGAYGNTGMNPLVSFQMWKTLALPRLLYDLDISKLCSLRLFGGVFCADCSVYQITLQMLLYTVYWMFALLSRKLTSENSPCSYPFYIAKTPYSLSMQKDKLQLRTVIVMVGSFNVINCFINTISRIYTI